MSKDNFWSGGKGDGSKEKKVSKSHCWGCLNGSGEKKDGKPLMQWGQWKITLNLEQTLQLHKTTIRTL